MAKLLAVGIATLDIINSVDHYPHEDDEIRAIEQRICRGGNATNTLVVLSQLGHQCHWAGVMVDEPDAKHIQQDLSRHHIDCGSVLQLSEGKVPTSYIIHNRRNGCRTIIHYRDLPEYPFEQFSKINLKEFDWLHFEGRNVTECARMLAHAKQGAPHLPRSLEVEKDRPGIDQLFTQTDLLLFSRDFAQARGFDSARGLLEHMAPLYPRQSLICAWGDKGAWGIQHNQLTHSPAFPPPRIIDTLAAGDTFNAGIIHALIQQQSFEQALINACQLAGRKCGHAGLAFIEGDKP